MQSSLMPLRTFFFKILGINRFYVGAFNVLESYEPLELDAVKISNSEASKNRA